MLRARLLIALCAACSTAVAIGARHLLAADDEPPTYKLTVSSAAEPKPALKYHLLTPAVDQVQGNAATFYYKVLAHEGIDPIDELSKLIGNEEKFAELFEAPLSKLPLDEARKQTAWMDDDYGDWLEQAARCDHCQWEDLVRQRGIYTLLPQAQKMRSLARAIALRARLQIANKEYDKAIKTLRWGYALSRHMGHAPSLVQSLIGMAIGTTMDDQVRILMEQDGAPNLYWALSEVAAKPIEIREGFSYESQFWEFTVHQLRDLDQRTLSDAEALKLADDVFAIVEMSKSNMRSNPLAPPHVGLLVWAVQQYPQARDYLLAHGYSASQLDEMPVLQVALLHDRRRSEQWRDDQFKWAALPDDELDWALLHEIDDERTIKASEGSPFGMAIPATRRVVSARMRGQRQTDLLRVIESLRWYAAEHGRWPDRLDQIVAVPVPNDRMTGKPFDYQLRDGVATLNPNEKMTTNAEYWAGAARYELTLRKP